MMEPVDFPDESTNSIIAEKPWATTGAKGRKPNLINSLFLDPLELEKHNHHLQRKYNRMAKEVLWENYKTEDAELVLVGYGTSARIAKAVVDQARALGIKVGLFRPISLVPFPKEVLLEACEQAKHVLVVEMSLGQLVEDVRYNLEFKVPVHLYGRVGGMVPTTSAVLEEVKRWVTTFEEVESI